MFYLPQICQVIVCVYSSTFLDNGSSPALGSKDTASWSRSIGRPATSNLNFPLSTSRHLPTSTKIFNNLSKNNLALNSVNFSDRKTPIILFPAAVEGDGKLNILLKSGLKFPIRIYGGGIEYRLPPLIELLVQRVQTFFSVYKYTDTSRPVLVQAVLDTGIQDQNVDLIPPPNHPIRISPAIDYPTDDDWESDENESDDDYIIVGERFKNNPNYKTWK